MLLSASSGCSAFQQPIDIEGHAYAHPFRIDSLRANLCGHLRADTSKDAATGNGHLPCILFSCINLAKCRLDARTLIIFDSVEMVPHGKVAADPEKNGRANKWGMGCCRYPMQMGQNSHLGGKNGNCADKNTKLQLFNSKVCHLKYRATKSHAIFRALSKQRSFALM